MYEIFEPCGSDELTKCLVLKHVAKQAKPIQWPPFKDIHEKNRMKQITNYKAVPFTDEYRATVKEQDG